MKEVSIALLVALIIWMINYLYKKNTLYYQIIKEFREKLSRPQTEARKLSDSQIERHPFIPNSFKDIRAIDVSTHKTAISESELDVFYNKLRYFDYSFVLFKKHYKGRTEEFLRLNPKSVNKDFHLVLLQEVLEENSLHPLEFRKVLVHHIKYEWKFTTYFYTWKIRKKQRDVLKKSRI
jgi:hypothetical protein